GFIALSQQKDLVFTSAAFDSATPVGIDLAAVPTPNSIDYKAAGDELLLGELFSVRNAAGKRVNNVHFYSLATKAETRLLQLDTGLGLSLRLDSIAWLPASNQVAARFV